jgi:glyoxylase-like metal-dependent hydrolase (beta-lactamase superfamily II)
VSEVTILVEGYVRESADELRVGSTVSFIRDGDALVVVDPGLVAAPAAILDPLRALGVEPEAITDVVFSHHHPDHTMHAALFPKADVHDVMAIYRADRWIDRPAEGFEISPGVRLIETPGHTREDITTLAETADGVVAFTHLWWSEDGPADDPYAFDREVLRTQRERVLGIASRIVPGHGAPFTPGADTPR